MEGIEEFGTIMTNSDTSNLANIQNSLYIMGKRKPSNHRYISSIEKEQKYNGASIRGSYKCHTCDQLGHNFAFHKKEIDCNQTCRKQEKN